MMAPIGSPMFRMRFECQILKCPKCKETFEIHWTESEDNETQFWAFIFTCKKITVLHHYKTGFSMGGKELLTKEEYYIPQKGTEYIPEFYVDFSDKKKLHKKLKTYLVFS